MQTRQMLGGTSVQVLTQVVCVEHIAETVVQIFCSVFGMLLVNFNEFYVCISVSVCVYTFVALSQLINKEINSQLDGQGKARREAARRRNSECKINLSCRNSSRGNGNRPTGYSAAVIGWQRGAATNVPRCRPITAAH